MKDLKKYEEMLRTRLQELDGRLHRIEAHLEQSPDSDWEEQAQASEMDEVLEGLGQAGTTEIEAIHAALARIEGGTYGICVRCGNNILEERLMGIPHTALCRDCAAKVASANKA